VRHLIRLITLRYLRAAALRTLLTIFGIVLGVAVVVAIEIVNGSVMASFRGTIDKIAGKTALTVGEGTGIAEELLEVVRAVPGVKVAVPVIRETARDVKTGTQLTVFGIDTVSDPEVRDYDVTATDVRIEDELGFLNDPKGVIITAAYAKRTGLKVGDVIELETAGGVSEFNVRGTLAPRGVAKVFGGDLLLMDVFAAQIAFGRGRVFDYIDVVPEAGAQVAALATKIGKAIGHKAEVARPERRTEEAEQIMGGFKLGLSMASLVAICVGAFIVYNALAIAVAQRRKEIGILRAIGVTRRRIMALFVGEGLLIGLIGSVAGIVAGILLARASIGLVGATLSQIYMQVQLDEISIAPGQLVAGLAVGVGVSFLAAFFPASRAAHVQPALAMRKKFDASDVALSEGRTSLWLGGAALTATVLAAIYAHARESSVVGYGAVGLFGLVAAFLSPGIARLVAQAARLLTRRSGPVMRMGVTGFERNAGRNAVAIAALGMALANVANAGFFLGSLKETTEHWIDRTLRADVFVFAGRQVGGRVERPISEAIRPELQAVPGVEFVDAMRVSRQRFRGRPFFVNAYDVDRYSRYNRIAVVEGDLDDAMQEIVAGTAVMASQPFMRQFRAKLGDVITLQTVKGPQPFRIALVYADYSSELGTLTMMRNAYKRAFDDALVDAYSVYVGKGVPMEGVRQRIAENVGRKNRLMVIANGEFKKEIRGVIDRSFSLMRVLELVAIIVALLGIVNTLIVSVIDRRMEIGILKAIGSARGQVQRMFMVEAWLLGLASSVLGIAFGSAISLYVVKELMWFHIGQQLTWQFSLWTVLETFVLAQAVALLAAWLPTRSAAKLDVVEALSYE
jgi:putative ABC transport system permease protein